MTSFPNWLAAVLLFIISLPLAVSAELPNADDRPFWTQKTCYREGDMVYGVGVAMEEKYLETARQKSFKAALWEIANFAQLTDTTLLLVETQMTYEEKNSRSAFSVWRLVKVPMTMLEHNKTVMKQNSALYTKMVDRVKHLEKESNRELAAELRLAVASSKNEAELRNEFFFNVQTVLPRNKKHEKALRDMVGPTAEIDGLDPFYWPDEVIHLKIRAKDNYEIKMVSFWVRQSHLQEKWTVRGDSFETKLSFSTNGLKSGENSYTLKVVDASGNAFVNNGTFQISELFDELRDILSDDDE